MLKRLGCVLLIAAIGCVAIAWSKADAVQRPNRAETVAPWVLVPSTAAKPCTVKPVDRSIIA